MDKMKNKKMLALLFLFIFAINLSAIAQTVNADAIIGDWLMPDDEGIIQIYKDGNSYSGKIIWMKEKEADGSPLLDKENPVDSLQNRQVEGLQIMSGFEYKGKNTWDGGTFYAPKKGKEVEPEFVMEDNNNLNIKISLFIFSLTIELKRINTAEFLIKQKMK